MIGSLESVLAEGDVDAVIVADQVEEEDRGVVTGPVRDALSGWPGSIPM
ncbi:MAG: hypothetical protein Ct9H300mP1_10520 [Planctomycetaceae bacterium]|nr:MAG: hypothetical protein Ct9H300mP1_10520 [Planctomycetaceae bacterium]